MKKRKRRGLRSLMAAALCFSLVAAQAAPTVYAARAEAGQKQTLCEHHPAHDEDCGYTGGSQGTACNHWHTEDCYKLAEHCIHVHTDDCYPQDGTSDNTATPAGAERREPTECTHRCSEDSGCVKQVLDCRHEHDSECGYTPATEGTPCTYVCEICHSQEKPQAGQDQCSCTEPCTGDKINEDCPVCGEDFAACKGVLPATPPDALAVTPEQVQEMIDDLPTAEELQAMTKEKQQEVYADLQAAYDAYEALTDGQKAEVTGAGIFDSLFGVFNGMMNAAAAAGDFEVTGGTSGKDYSYADGVLTINDGAELTISTNGQTSDRIVIAKEAKATVILNGVNIGGTFDNEESAIDVSSGAALNIILQAGSANTIGVDYPILGESSPGIHVPTKAVLVIQGNGFLSVKGGTGTSGMGSVGIGGKNGKRPSASEERVPGEDCGMVVILGKNVEVEGSQGSDPIGGGFGLTNGRPGDGDDGQGIRPNDDGSYEVWGSLTLPEYPASYTIPAGVTLTIPDNTGLEIPSRVTLINHGTITGDGTLKGGGTLTGDGVVTVASNEFQSDSDLTLTIEGGTGGGSAPYTAAYGSAITLKAKVEQRNTRALSAGGYNTVTFSVGMDNSKKELGTVKVENNEASLADVEIKAENGWEIGLNAITAAFSGHSHLKPAEGNATLFVEMGTPLPPDGPSGINKAATTSVTLTPVTGSNDKGDIQYGYTTGTMASPTNWQSSLAFEGLTPGTVYTFHTRYAGNNFYLPSAPSGGLKVVTAPAVDAVTIDYAKETIQFAEHLLEVNGSREFSNTPVSNNGSIAPYIGQTIYVRVKSENDADAPIRGITEASVPARPAAPAGLTAHNTSAGAANDGRITGLDRAKAYQYSLDGTDWTGVPAGSAEIAGLAADTYQVRLAAVENSSFASAPVTLTVQKPSTPVVPGETVRYIVEHYKADKDSSTGYTLADTEYPAGKIGETVTAAPKKHDGYAYNAGKSTAGGKLKEIKSESDILTLKLFYDLAEYTVTLETEGQGTASASPASAVMGETVTLTADAASGYYFKGWEAVAGDVIINGGRFIMPGENVIVKAVFEKDAGNGGSSGGGSSSSDDSDGSGGSGSPDTWSVPAGTWVRDQTGWWYRKADGTYPVSCWQRLAYGNTAEWYHFDERGYMQTGWFTGADGRTYYLHAVSDGRQGYMYTGWHQIGGVWYYFREIQDRTEGVLYKNSRTPDGYWVDENGVWEP